MADRAGVTAGAAAVLEVTGALSADAGFVCARAGAIRADAAAPIVRAAGRARAVGDAGHTGAIEAPVVRTAADADALHELAVAEPLVAHLPGERTGPVAEAAATIIVTAERADAVRLAGGADPADAVLGLPAAGAVTVLVEAITTEITARLEGAAGAAIEAPAAAIRRRSTVRAEGVAGRGRAAAAVVAERALITAGAVTFLVLAAALEPGAADLVPAAAPAGEGPAAAVRGGAAARAELTAGRRDAAGAAVADRIRRAAGIAAADIGAGAGATHAGLEVPGTGPLTETTTTVRVATVRDRAVGHAGTTDAGVAGLTVGAARVAAGDVDTGAGAVDADLVCAGAGAITEPAAAVRVATARPGAGRDAVDAAPLEAGQPARTVTAVEAAVAAIRLEAALEAELRAGGRRTAGVVDAGGAVRAARVTADGEVAFTVIVDAAGRVGAAGAAAQGAAAAVGRGTTGDTQRRAGLRRAARALVADRGLAAAHPGAIHEGTRTRAVDAGLVVAGTGSLAEAAAAVVVAAARAGTIRDTGRAGPAVAELPRRAARVAARDVVTGTDEGTVAGRIRAAGPAIQRPAAAVRRRAAVRPRGHAGLGRAARALMTEFTHPAAGVAAGDVGALAGPPVAAGLRGTTGAALQRAAAAVGGRPAGGAQAVAGRDVATDALRAALTGTAALIAAREVVAGAEAIEAGRVGVFTGPEAETVTAVVVAAGSAGAVRDAGDTGAGVADLAHRAAGPVALDGLTLAGAGDAGLVRAGAEAVAEPAAAVVVTAGCAVAGRRAARTGEAGLPVRAAGLAAHDPGALTLEGPGAGLRGTAVPAEEDPAAAVGRLTAGRAQVFAGLGRAARALIADLSVAAAGVAAGEGLADAEPVQAELVGPGAETVADASAAVVVAAARAIAVGLTGDTDAGAALLTAGAAAVSTGDVRALAGAVLADLERAGTGPVTEAAAAVVITAERGVAVGGAGRALPRVAGLAGRATAAGEVTAAAVRGRTALDAEERAGLGTTAAPLEADRALGAAGVAAGVEGAVTREVVAAELIIGAIAAGQEATAAIARGPAGSAEEVAGRGRAAGARVTDLVHVAAAIAAGRVVALTLAEEAEFVLPGAGAVAEALAAVVRAAGLPRAVRLAGDTLAGLAGLPGAATALAAGDVLADARAGLTVREGLGTGPRAEPPAAVVIAAGRAAAGRGAAATAEADLGRVAAGAVALGVGAGALPVHATLGQGAAGPAVQGAAAAIGGRTALRVQVAAARGLAAAAGGADRILGAAGAVAGVVLADAGARLTDLVGARTGAVTEPAAAIVVPTRCAGAVRGVSAGAVDACHERDVTGTERAFHAIVEGKHDVARDGSHVVESQGMSKLVKGDGLDVEGRPGGSSRRDPGERGVEVDVAGCGDTVRRRVVAVSERGATGDDPCAEPNVPVQAG